jgi:glycosyltransferase involved in cell wall biosynthesis
MANASLHVTASEKEMFGLTVLEAMATGTPVVGPAAAGVKDLVRDGENGHLYMPGDAAGLQRILIDLADDELARRRLGAGALAMARERTWDQGLREWFAAIH